MTTAETASLTKDAVDFAVGLTYDAIPDDALTIARRCVLDGLAVMIGGSEQPALEVMARYIDRVGGTPDARLLGNAKKKVPAHLAALWYGLAGHAMDWDDTQLSEGPGRMYGLLTHPTVPPLSACLAIGEMLGGVDGKTFLTAFNAGFEVECKIAEAINPDHYARGFHTSGTIGTFGSAVAAAKMLNFNHSQMAQTIGIAASLAAGIRANFGTMTKPLHVGRSSENGVTAALLVRDGFTANTEALDGKWGYLTIAGPGGDPDLVLGRFGNPLTIMTPGVSIKPYPCGVLTHPSMDALKFLMRDEKVKAEDIEKIKLYAAQNILGPIRYDFATTELEGKFCMHFLLAAIAIAGKAGKREFTDEFVSRADVGDMQRRVETIDDKKIEAMGYDRIRSRVEVITKDGRTLELWADENYRGSPHNPLTDDEVEGKFRDCAEGLLVESQIKAVIDRVWKLEDQANVTDVLADLHWQDGKARAAVA
ncbi:MAG: MmgE/PrpD family protein [Proteobacteria bacterium]|nr:MmgE/PrpD family protein [Pseudomonadota bacterium]MDA1057268.1 MmgE/PrpD family protein [Pseudomonadota bacterium]